MYYIYDIYSIILLAGARCFGWCELNRVEGNSNTVQEMALYKFVRLDGRRIVDCILYSHPFVKVKVLFVLVIIASGICSISFAPRTYFDNRKNLLNRVFVKWSWGWTLLLLLPLVTLSSYVYEKADKMSVFKNLIRIGVAHVIWFIVTTVFRLLDHAVGTCSNAAFEHRSACHSNGSVWYGFDISGHTFLLSYCILVITEECIPVSALVWLQAGKNIISSITELNHLHKAYYKISPVMSVLRLYAVVLILLATLMTLTTNLYFHTMPEKILGFLIAVTCWYVTYSHIYGGVWFIPKPDHTTKELFQQKDLVYSHREQLY